MFSLKVVLTLIVGVCVVKVAMAMPILTSVNQSGCHNSIILLNCVSFNQNQNGNSLRWRYKNPTSSAWETLATVANGNQNPSWSGTQFHQRLILHANGSLEIKSLKSHDETLYQCRVSALGRRNTHIINLSVACYGQSTHVQKQVCKGDDTLLDCNARHRTNPKYLKHTTWRQKNQMGTWHQVATTSAGRVNANYKLHQNGSLLVQGQGNNVDRIKFRCIATKNKYSLPKERHHIEIKYVKCEKNKTSAPTSVTLKGRAAMTTISPINPTQNVCGGSLIDATGQGGFQSPNFPSAYPANSYCKWTISVPKDYAAIDLTLEQMDLEPDNDCQHDYIAIYDNLGNQVGCRRCGIYNKPRQFQVGGRVAVVVFRTDSNVQKTGFKLTYKAAMQVGNAGP